MAHLLVRSPRRAKRVLFVSWQLWMLDWDTNCSGVSSGGGENRETKLTERLRLHKAKVYCTNCYSDPVCVGANALVGSELSIKGGCRGAAPPAPPPHCKKEKKYVCTPSWEKSRIRLCHVRATSCTGWSVQVRLAIISKRHSTWSTVCSAQKCWAVLLWNVAAFG